MSKKTRKCNCDFTEDTCKKEPEFEQLRTQIHDLQEQIQQLTELVRTDALTGLYNHRYFREALHREVERTQRTGADCCLVLIDLDHFKLVNDTWGHEVGNLALKHAANLIRFTIRPMDLPCRYGGEEFALLFPSTPLITSKQIAERIRDILEKTPLECENHSIKLTASFGIASYSANSLLTEDQLIEKADQQLYIAKNQGRNQVCAAIPEQNHYPQVSQEEKDLLNNLFDNNQ